MSRETVLAAALLAAGAKHRSPAEARAFTLAARARALGLATIQGQPKRT